MAESGSSHIIEFPRKRNLTESFRSLVSSAQAFGEKPCVVVVGTDYVVHAIYGKGTSVAGRLRGFDNALPENLHIFGTIALPEDLLDSEGNVSEEDRRLGKGVVKQEVLNTTRALLRPFGSPPISIVNANVGPDVLA